MPENCNRWGGDQNGKIDYPVKGFAISIREKADECVGSGTIFFDDLEIVSEAPQERQE